MLAAQRDPHPRWSPPAGGQVVCQLIVKGAGERAEEVKFPGAGYGTDRDVVLRLGHGTLLLRRAGPPGSEAGVTPEGSKRSEYGAHGLTLPSTLRRCHHGTTAEHMTTRTRSVAASARNARSCAAQTVLPTGRNSRQNGG